MSWPVGTPLIAVDVEWIECSTWICVYGTLRAYEWWKVKVILITKYALSKTDLDDEIDSHGAGVPNQYQMCENKQWINSKSSVAYLIRKKNSFKIESTIVYRAI